MIIGIDPGWVGWLAGVMDGEGNIRIKKRGNCNSFIVNILIVNTDLKMLQKVKDLVGYGTIVSRERTGNRKTMHTWSAGSREAREILELIIGHLVTKKERALLAIKLQSRLSKRVGMTKAKMVAHGKSSKHPKAPLRKITKKEYQIRDRIYQKMKHLNLRGVNKL